MTALRSAAALALLAPALAAGEGEWPRTALSLEGALSRFPQAPRLAAGGALSARFSFAEAALVLDWPLARPGGDAGRGPSALLGAGIAADLGPRASLHGLAVAGSYHVLLRDYVYDGWRDVAEGAWGLRAGVRFHPPAALGNLGLGRLWPVGGLWLTVLQVGRGSDQLRSARWGGTLAVVTLSLGAELDSVPHDAPAPR